MSIIDIIGIIGVTDIIDREKYVNKKQKTIKQNKSQ